MSEFGERNVIERAIHFGKRAFVVGGLTLVAACGSRAGEVTTAAGGTTAPVEVSTTPQAPTSTESETPEQTTTSTTRTSTTTSGRPAPSVTTTTSGRAPETATTTTEAKPQSETEIYEDGIGGIRIGKSLVDLKASGYKLSESCDTQSFGVEGTTADLGVGIAIDENGRVKQVSIFGSSAKTAEGIGVGSSKDEVIDVYEGLGRETSTSVLNGLHGDLDYIFVPGERADIHIQISPETSEVSSVTFTSVGTGIDFACD